MVKSLLTLLSIFLLQTVAFPEVKLNSKVDKAKATTSDTITFSIVLKRPKDLQINLPNIGRLIEGFRVVDFDTDKIRFEDGEATIRRWFKLEADISGTYILPAIKISYQNNKGETEKIKSSEIFVEIESPYSQDKKDGKKTPKDIKDIKDIIQFKSYILLIVIISFFLFIAAGAGVYFFIKKRKNSRPEKVIPPHITALAQLKDLASSPLKSKEERKLFCFKLSEIIRLYFENSFNFPATDRTTYEIKEELKPETSLNDEYKKLFLKILEQTDVIKFTDSDLPEGENLKMLDNTKSFVENTMPKANKIEEEESVI